MAKGNLSQALAYVFEDEGGYVDHPRDPGGATNMGITRRTLERWRKTRVSKGDVKRLTRKEASAIYETFYWDVVKADDLPPGVDYCVFDAAVHSGFMRAIRWLQTEAGVKADGIIGPVTLAAAERLAPAELVRRYCARRLSFMRRLRNWRTFGRGWSRRMVRVQERALAIVDSSPRTVRLMLKERERSMNDTKKWYASKTVWGAVITLMALTAGALGYPIGAVEQAALTELLPQIVATIGAFVALVGRLTAKSVIA